MKPSSTEVTRSAPEVISHIVARVTAKGHPAMKTF